MPIPAATQNAMCAAWTANAAYAEASSSTASTTAGTALTPTTRSALTWSTPSGGSSSSTASFPSLASGQTIQSVNLYSAATGGTFWGTLAVTSQPLNSNTNAVNAALTYSYTQTT